MSQGVYIKNRQYFKFVMFLSKEVEIDMNFYMKKEFCKNIDYFLTYFAICEQIFPTFSYIAQLIFLHTMGKLTISPFYRNLAKFHYIVLIHHR